MPPGGAAAGLKHPPGRGDIHGGVQQGAVKREPVEVVTELPRVVNGDGVICP